MQRREFLLGLSAAPALLAASRIDLSRMSILTDECAKTHEEAVDFAHHYGLKWVELRGVPSGTRGGNRDTYAFMEEAELKGIAKSLKDAGLGVSFLNTPLLKFPLVGITPLTRNPETPEQKATREERSKVLFAERIDKLKLAIRSAHILNVDIVRVFAFSRVAEPESVFPRVAEVLNEYADIAEKEGITLLVENEASCNVATSAELARICQLVPRKGLGINWDPVNAMHRQEKPWPDGYQLLPKTKIHNVQMKAEALVLGNDLIDWAAVFQTLQKDGYTGHVGLETHVFDGTLIEKSHMCMKKILEIVKS